MNCVEAPKKYEETDISCNQSQITRVDSSNPMQLPLKKRRNQTRQAAQLGGSSMLTTDRVTRISSGTIKPRSFSDLRKVSIKTSRNGVTGCPGIEGTNYRTPKQGKHLKSDAKSAQIVEIQRLENERTMSENGMDLPNSDTRPHDSVLGRTKTIAPCLSAVVTNVRHSNANHVMQTPDETILSTVPQQRNGGKRNYDQVSSNSDCEDHHHARNMLQISYDGKQSEDAILDEVVAAVCQMSNQNLNVCDGSGSEVESTASLSANKPECSGSDHFVFELKSEQLDRACISSQKNTSVKVVCDDATKNEEHVDAGMCLESMSEQCNAEHPVLGYVEQCPNDSEVLQVFDALNPEENKLIEVRRSQKQGPRKQQHFRCTTCKLRFFETKDELEIHVECHVGKPGDPEFYRCKICPYSSPFWNRTLSHIIVHDEYKKRLAETRLAQNILGKFLCPECGRSFERKVNMQGHLKKVHFKENHTCDQCGLTLSGVDKKTFTRHQEKCRNVKIACTFCDYTTTVTTNMQKHMKIHNGEGFACTDCAAVFPTRQRFQVHLLTHRTDRPRYGCEYCGMMFVSEDSVKKHCVRLHQNIERSIACPLCPYVARMKVDLKKHVQAVHEKKIKCSNCPYSTNSDHAFEQHRSYHLADRVFACSVVGCFYRGSSAKQVATHNSSVHHQNSKHQCPVCKKYYKKKTHLLRHLVSHTGDRAYSCLECGQSFFSHSSYYRHRRRLRHDENRDSIASVPQNITIQYLDEAAEVVGNLPPSADVIEGKPVEEAMSNVQVLYEQILQQSSEPLLRSLSSARVELTSLLMESSQDLMLEEAKCEDSAITYLVEVKREANGDSNQAYYAISEQRNNSLEQGYYISNVVDNVSSLLEVPTSAGNNLSEAPQYTLVVLPKDGTS